MFLFSIATHIQAQDRTNQELLECAITVPLMN